MTVTTTTDLTPQGDHLALGIRSLALKRYSDACDHLSRAVEESTERHGELAEENADALILYGKALLASAIAQSAVLGGGAPGPEPSEAGPSTAAAGPFASASSASAAAPAAGSSNAAFHFGGDEEDDQEEGEGEGDGEGEDGGEEAPGADREDDLESAFQVLDMARTVLSRAVERIGTELGIAETKATLEEEQRKTKEKLAEVHRLLGDVATESEQFDSAVTEYSSSLTVLSSFLPPYDRALSELHMLIALALDFVPNATARAVSHAEKAKEVLLMKLKELEKVEEGNREEKVKREIEDIKGLMGDVDMKIEDLRTIPTAPTPTASDSALEALLRDSMSAVASAAASGTVNDLTGLVKKKKRPAAPVEAPAEAEVEGEGEGKEVLEGQGKGEKRKIGAGGEEENGQGEAKKVKLDV
ncbi:hypothetical protein JCM11641_005142 [Rhodosporidiobolus odoratus]